MLIINGNGASLKGGRVRAIDLRAGAALALCGLIAEGETEIQDAWQIRRGYMNFPEKLRALGAKVDQPC
jgi:UDP-N-acetylglucosamine 1-carboxyvinyltransferase